MKKIKRKLATLFVAAASVIGIGAVASVSPAHAAGPCRVIVYSSTNYNGTYLDLSMNHGTTVQLSSYGWSGVTSSFKTIGCAFRFWKNSGLSAYPHNPVSGNEAVLLSGWDNTFTTLQAV